MSPSNDFFGPSLTPTTSPIVSMPTNPIAPMATHPMPSKTTGTMPSMTTNPMVPMTTSPMASMTMASTTTNPMAPMATNPISPMTAASNSMKSMSLESFLTPSSSVPNYRDDSVKTSSSADIFFNSQSSNSTGSIPALTPPPRSTFPSQSVPALPQPPKPLVSTQPSTGDRSNSMSFSSNVTLNSTQPLQPNYNINLDNNSSSNSFFDINSMSSTAPAMYSPVGVHNNNSYSFANSNSNPMYTNNTSSSGNFSAVQPTNQQQNQNNQLFDFL